MVRREGRKEKARSPIVKTRGSVKQPPASKAGSNGVLATGTMGNPMYIPANHPMAKKAATNPPLKAENIPQGSAPGVDIYSNEELGVCTYVRRKVCAAKAVDGKPYCPMHLCPQCGINQKSSRKKLCGECGDDDDDE